MLGLLSLRLHQEVDYFTEIAKRGILFHIPVVRFIPSHIDPKTELVTGLSYDNPTQLWKEDTFPIPPFLYDRCYYNNSQAAIIERPIVEWLKKRPQTVFLGHGLPDKLQIYSILSRNSRIAPYLPATQKATVESIWKSLLKNREVVLKPIYGSQGNGYCYISLNRSEILVLMQTHEPNSYIFITREKFFTWLSQHLENKNYIQQPFLSIQEQKRPFDIRILLQKNEKGVWTEIGRGVRRGNLHSLVSNLAAGSQVIPYEEWKLSYTKYEISILEDVLSVLVKAVPEALEETLPPLFELGLDISIDRNRHIWLLDINSKPGRKVIAKCNPSCKERLYRAPLAYCQYLSKTVKGAKVK